MTTLTLVLAIALALMIGLVVGWYVGRSGNGSSDALQQENSQLRADLAGASEAREILASRVESLEERARADADVLQALAPVKMQLSTMEKSVRTMETQRAEQFGSVSEALKNSAITQEQLREVTSNLSGALRSTSARGTWGEAQLRRVVEAAGMTAHVAFSEQVTGNATSAKDQDKAVRPDMVIYLPGGKTIVVDAKSPLNAYLNAQEATDEKSKASELAQHARAVKSHVDALATKKYWSGFEASPELVLCFIPAESALSAALQTDAQLLDYAASKNVALVSPVSLLAALKAISFSWRQDALTDNARELFVLSKQLYERLGTAGTHLSSMGKLLTRTVESYNGLVGSLETRVFVTARKIAGLDSAQFTDDLSPTPIDSSVKPLTSAEFLDQPEQPAATASSDEKEATDDAETAYSQYLAAFDSGDLANSTLEPVEEEDHTIDPNKSAYTPHFEDVPLWEQYPEGFSDEIDDHYDGPAVITEHPYSTTQGNEKAAHHNDERPIDYDSWAE
ncbi:MAG: DNA recombination protein RmuC [Rothia sp. (in: high G+C Gram-positive bacteria)]|nr:DNA recombination protein RmuC [Rothia sp. (in: high G+C Gram-positive bacteria)]